MQSLTTWRIEDLRQQALEFERNRHGDGHNRRPIRITVNRLRNRYTRRERRRRLTSWTQSWAPARPPQVVVALPSLRPALPVRSLTVPLAAFWPRGMTTSPRTRAA
jgi:hypothetical protein